VHLVQVDAVGAEATQAGLAAGDDVVAGKPGIVWTLVASSTSSRRPLRTSPTISSARPPE